jgi:hypothetical protein
LLAAHGAGLLACLTVLRDYATTPQLKGIGVLIVLFCVGLVGSMCVHASFSLGRVLSLTQFVRGDRTNRQQNKFVQRWASFFWWLLVVGLALSLSSLLAAIGFVVYRFAYL